MIPGSRRRNRRLTPARGSSAWIWFIGAFFTAAMLLALGGGVYWVLDPRNLPIREVRVDGEFLHLSSAHLQSIVAAGATGGFFSVNVENIRAAVMSDPWVKDVYVRRVWPDGLRVTVVEQRPIAYWGRNDLLSDEGKVFHPAAESFPAGLLHLSGPDGLAGLVLARYRQLQGWFEPLGLRVARLDLSPRRAWAFEMEGGPRVIVGRADFEARVRRFIATLPRSIGEHLRETASIDLRYTNGFAVRPRVRADANAG